MASNCKYTNPTGPGYAGIYSLSEWSAQIAIGSLTHIDWRSDDTVVAVDLDDEPGIQLVRGPHADAIDECDVHQKGMGTIVYVHPPAIRTLEGLECGADVRAYEYDSSGLTIVPAATDPFVPEDALTAGDAQ